MNKETDDSKRTDLDEILLTMLMGVLAIALFIINVRVVHGVGVFSSIEPNVLGFFCSVLAGLFMMLLEILGVRILMRKLRIKIVMESF